MLDRAKNRWGLVVQTLLIVFVLLAARSVASAQDPIKVGPDIYKLVFESDRVRAMEVTFKPGAKIGMHAHPDHFVYILSPGKLKITTAAGTTMDLEGKAGESAFIKAESHMAENVGSTEFKGLVVELKEPAPAPVEKPKE